jgi:hypothetical protein
VGTQAAVEPEEGGVVEFVLEEDVNVGLAELLA